MVPFTTPIITRLIGDTHPPRRAASDRLAELVHQLSDVRLIDARRAVHHHTCIGRLDDPLAIVAAALVQLRHQPTLTDTQC